MSGEITCTCGYINEEEANNCFNCGYPLVYERYVELFKCPVHYGHPNTRYCYKCGVYLVPQDEYEPVKYSPGVESCVICLDNRREVAFIPCGLDVFV